MDRKAAKQRRVAQAKANLKKRFKRQTADVDISGEETSDESGSDKTEVKSKVTKNCIVNLEKGERISSRSAQHSKERQSIADSRSRAIERKSLLSTPGVRKSRSRKSESKTSSNSDESDDGSEQGSSIQSKRQLKRSKKGKLLTF